MDDAGLVGGDAEGAWAREREPQAHASDAATIAMAILLFRASTARMPLTRFTGLCRPAIMGLEGKTTSEIGFADRDD